MQSRPKKLILASSSTTRHELLRRFNLAFETISPEIDESPLVNETAEQLAIRLSRQKAAVISQHYPEHVVIGSDQVAFLPTTPIQWINKPGHVDAAIAQLSQCSGQWLHFCCGLSVQSAAISFEKTLMVPFAVKFRQLSKDEISRYTAYDQPWHCAGSFKLESLGISLFEQMQGDDFTALMGMPLVELSRILRALDFQIP